MIKLSNENNGESEIKNFFFLLERGFRNAFNLKNEDDSGSSGEKSHY